MAIIDMTGARVGALVVMKRQNTMCPGCEARKALLRRLAKRAAARARALAARVRGKAR